MSELEDPNDFTSGNGMILNFQNFEIDERIILQHVVFHPPLKANVSMEDEACFLYPLRGNSRLLGPMDSHEMNPESGVVMKCGSYLNNWLPVDGDSPCEAVAIHFNPAVLKAVFNDQIPDFLQNKRPTTPVSIQPVQINEMLRTYVQSLLFYFENPSMVNDELLRLKVKELIMLLVKSDESNKIISILQDLFNPDQYDFKAVIQNNLFEALSVEELAVLTNLSVSSFKRKFKAVFGDSPASYIKSKRLEKAAQLLQITTQRITDICYDCGFSDIGHFSKSFAAAYGVSPSDYRFQKSKQQY